MSVSDIVPLNESKLIYGHLQILRSNGGKAGSRRAKSIAAKRTAKARWALRVARYGPSGRKHYSGWISRQYGGSEWSDWVI